MSKVTEPVPFVRDRAVLLLLGVNSLLVLATVTSVIVRLRSHDFKVPIQYVVNDGSVLQTSAWFNLYLFVLFSVFTGICTAILAQRMHKSQRTFSLIILGLFAVVSIFGLLATSALLGLVAQV